MSNEPPFDSLHGQALTGKEPPSDSAIVLCTDPDCPVAWAYKDPPREHWHPLPHGPRVEVPICLLCGEPGRILCEEHR